MSKVPTKVVWHTYNMYKVHYIRTTDCIIVPWQCTTSKDKAERWTLHVPVVSLQAAYLWERQDQKGSTATGFHYNCQKLWVNCTEWAVPCHFGNPNIIITLIRLHRLPKNMPELTLAHNAATHSCEKTEKGWKSIKHIYCMCILYTE